MYNSFVCIAAMIVLIIAAFIKLNNKIVYILLACTMIPALYFTIFIQYWYKDNEGNFAGMLILSGTMSFIILGEIIKSHMDSVLREKYAYIVSIVMVVYSLLGVMMALYYNAKVYALSLCIFIAMYIIPNKIISNRFVYSLLCFGAVYGSIPIWYLSKGSHEGLFGIKGYFGVIVFIIFSATLLISMFRYRKYVECGFISKLGFNAIIVCLITACFDKYILSVPFCLYYIIYACCCTSNDNTEYAPFDIQKYQKELCYNWLKQMMLSVIVIIPIVESIFILGPLEIYQANRYAFKFDYKQFVGWFLLIAFLSCTIIGLLCIFLEKNTFRFIISVLFTLSIMSYIQYMFMNIKLVSDDGGPLDFSELNVYIKWNSLIWILFIFLSIVVLYFAKDKWNTIIKSISTVLIIIQSVAVISILINLISMPGPRYYQFTGENQYKVGSEKNIIIIILDTYSRGDLDRVLVKYPNALDGLKDFTYYPNTSSEYTSTFPSIPHMLTGQEYEHPEMRGRDNEIREIEWLKEAWNTDDCTEFYKEIHELGYVVNLHTGDGCDIFGAYDDIKDCIDNIEPASGHINKREMLRLLVKMSCYRYLPYAFKPKFEVLTFDFDPLVSYDTINSQELDSDIYDSLKTHGLEQGNVEKMIKIQHSRGMHRPFLYNEDCELLQNNEGNLEDCGKGLLVCVDEYLKCLKDVDAYDSSTIFIMADHGPSSMDPIFFIKQENERHDSMVTSERPFFYSDMRATIMDSVGGNAKKYGNSIMK